MGKVLGMIDVVMVASDESGGIEKVLFSNNSNVVNIHNILPLYLYAYPVIITNRWISIIN